MQPMMLAGSSEDPANFASPDFNPKAYVNAALLRHCTEGEGGGAAGVSMGGSSGSGDHLQLSILLTKLQLAASDVDADVNRYSVELAGAAPGIVRELGLVREQATAVRSELTSLLDEVASLKGRSEAAVGRLRDAVSVRERFTSTARTLQQADRVSALLRTADSSMARSDAAAAAAAASQLGGALAALGEDMAAKLFPDAGTRQAALRSQILDRLKPELLRAVREHDAGAMPRLSSLYADLGAAEQVRDAYVQCAQGPIFESWNAARREARAADALEALWRCLDTLVPAERQWVTTAFKRAAQGSGEAADELLPALVGDALEAIGGQMADVITGALPADEANGVDQGDSGGDGVGGESPLPELWAEALRRAAALRGELGWERGDQAPAGGGAQRVADALLLPFEPAQRQFAASLVPRFRRRLPPIPIASDGAARRPLSHAASAVERSTAALTEVLHSATATALSFGGPLGAEGTAGLVSALVEAHCAALAQAFPALRAPSTAHGSAGVEGNGEGGVAASAATAAAGRGGGGDGCGGGDDDDLSRGGAFAGSVEDSRDALSLLRAVQVLRERILRAEAGVISQLQRSAAACEAAPLQTAAQRAAAAAILGGATNPPQPTTTVVTVTTAAAAAAAVSDGLPGARAAVAALVAAAQHVALDSLMAPIAVALRRVGSAELTSVWREGLGEEGSASEGLLAFSASPQAYITAVGDHLLGLPQQLEPFAEGPALHGLALELLRGSGGGSGGDSGGGSETGAAAAATADGVHAWLSALGGRTVELLLRAVMKITSLSTLGARQLSADTAYVNNILSAGLGLRQDERLSELAELLTATGTQLTAARASESEPRALPASLVHAIATKRGVQAAHK